MSAYLSIENKGWTQKRCDWELSKRKPNYQIHKNETILTCSTGQIENNFVPAES